MSSPEHTIPHLLGIPSSIVSKQRKDKEFTKQKQFRSIVYPHHQTLGRTVGNTYFRTFSSPIQREVFSQTPFVSIHRNLTIPEKTYFIFIRSFWDCQGRTLVFLLRAMIISI